MNKAVIDDLKQFITSTVFETVSKQGDSMLDELKQFVTITVTQQTSVLREELRKDIRKDLLKLELKLESKIDALTEFVAQTIDSNDELYELRHKDHEKRITKLEARTN